MSNDTLLHLQERKAWKLLRKMVEEKAPEGWIVCWVQMRGDYEPTEGTDWTVEIRYRTENGASRHAWFKGRPGRDAPQTVSDAVAALRTIYTFVFKTYYLQDYDPAE